MLAWRRSSERIQTANTWPIDPLGLRNVQLEVSEQLPQGASGQRLATLWRNAGRLSRCPKGEDMRREKQG